MPSNQTEIEGNTATFTVAATADAATSYTAGTPNYDAPGNADGGLNYQWYLGDPTSGGTALVDDATYSGVTTASLNIVTNLGLDGTIIAC